MRDQEPCFVTHRHRHHCRSGNRKRCWVICIDQNNSCGTPHVGAISAKKNALSKSQSPRLVDNATVGMLLLPSNAVAARESPSVDNCIWLPHHAVTAGRCHKPAWLVDCHARCYQVEDNKTDMAQFVKFHLLSGETHTIRRTVLLTTWSP